MGKPFVYGTAVFGENFTDRKAETKHLKMNLEAGVNTILISPRRTGKTSLVYRAVEQITDPSVKIVMMDIYDCRDEYEFYERFASAILKSLATKAEQAMTLAKSFLSRLSPKISISPDPSPEFSVSFGIGPKTEKPEETILVAANFDNMAHEKFRVGVPFMCTAKPILCSSDQKYGSNASLRKTTRKAKKQKWDERAYAVDIDIPPMSVTYYQLTPCEEPVEKPKKQTNVKEAKPAAAKKTDIKKKPAAPKREAPKTVKAEPKKSVRAKSKTETKPKKTEKKTAEKPVVTENLAQKATEVTAAAKKTVTKKAAEVTTEAKRVVTKKAADVTRAAKKAAEVSETAKKTVTKKATDMTTAAKKTVAKKAKEKK